ncbi:hypothetical protein LIA77_02579 [Sarocladium implicatum]|nr:hypothetical protein LIA77_02579 [Sarocladium implicatum]
MRRRGSSLGPYRVCFYLFHRVFSASPCAACLNAPLPRLAPFQDTRGIAFHRRMSVRAARTAVADLDPRRRATRSVDLSVADAHPFELHQIGSPLRVTDTFMLASPKISPDPTPLRIDSGPIDGQVENRSEKKRC